MWCWCGVGVVVVWSNVVLVWCCSGFGVVLVDFTVVLVWLWCVFGLVLEWLSFVASIILYYARHTYVLAYPKNIPHWLAVNKISNMFVKNILQSILKWEFAKGVYTHCYNVYERGR